MRSNTFVKVKIKPETFENSEQEFEKYNGGTGDRGAAEEKKVGAGVVRGKEIRIEKSDEMLGISSNSAADSVQEI